MKDCFYIRGGRVLDPARGQDAVGDLCIQKGVIVPCPARVPPGARVIDAAGCGGVPGFIDLHVHLREPGNEAAETVATGTRAAARGGFTTIVAMPNTRPALDSPAEIRALAKRAAGGFARVLPAPCLTHGREGLELADIDALATAGAVALTDDGATVADDALMAEAMRRAARANLPVCDHALDPVLAGKGVMHEGEWSRKWGLPGIPSEAESRTVARDIRLAEAAGCALHIQHVSAAESVQLIREAVRRGVRVTAEATPHHLALTDADVRPEDARFKMNPPLRGEADRIVLLEAVADGTLTTLATDHAPHTAAAKAKGFVEAPFGVIGLETAIGVTYAILVKSGRISLADWVRRWTTGPARVLGRPAPSLAVGAPADVAVLNLTDEWTVRADDFVSLSRNTPFEGWRLTGRAMATFCGGKQTWG